MEINKIVTFSCSSSVHIYMDGCSVYPAKPYKIHDTIKDAIKHLKKCGKTDIKQIINERV
jgi:hypothetical protein